jgi:hypothetical protein
LAVSTFKAIELDAITRQRTGREFQLEADSRQAAVEALLAQLEVSPGAAHVDATRTLVLIGDTRWSIVNVQQAVVTESASLRRGGAKHKQVR